MKVETEVVGEDKVLLNLQEMRDRAMDARPATQRVREIFLDSDRLQFESEGSHLGAPWAPLAEATRKRKAREGIDPRPMHGKSGDLEKSLEGGKGKRSGATKTTAGAGTNVWYSVFARGTKGSLHSHNTGERARKLVGVTNDEQDEVLATVAGYIVHGTIA